MASTARRITCPGCGQSEEGFTLISEIYTATDIDDHGQPKSGNDFANEGRRRFLNCPSCGRSWRTSRQFNIALDVR